MSRVVQLKTENRYNPINIDRRQPEFSWRMETDETNWYQKAYRIRVYREKEMIWDSGVVESRQMNRIRYEGKGLEPLSEYRWNVEVISENGEEIPVSEDGRFETAMFSPGDWKAGWLGENDDEGYHIYRKVFDVRGKVKRARLAVCALGQSDCMINGAPVSDAVLEPGWTDYRKSCMYTVYDITGQLKTGRNCAAVMLSDGMYHVKGGRYVYYERVFGDRKLLAQIQIVYENDEIEYTGTDESWHMGPSPIKFGCIYGGEDYDARVPFAEASLSEFEEDDSWKAAQKAEAPDLYMRAAAAPPLAVMERYEPVNVIRLGEKEYLYDLGKNHSGRVRIRIERNEAAPGTEIVMLPGEILGEDNRPDQRVTGKGYAWTYFLNAEKTQEYAAYSTYTGYRYVLVKGAVWKGVGEAEPGIPVICSMTGEFIYPKMEESGGFYCSNKLFNDIHGIIRQAILSNIKSYFTDCPHREKLGWLEETHLIGPAMMCSYDLSALYEKIEQDMADSQWDNGLVPDISPEYVTCFGKWNTGFVDSPEWGSACVINPWNIYSRYGSSRLLRESYPVMKKYTDYLTSKSRHGILNHGLGDWLDIGPCTPYSQNTPVCVTATAIYYIDLDIMRRTAGMLDIRSDEKHYAELMKQVYEEYNALFLDDQTGRYANGSQAAQAMSLMAGLVPEALKQKAVQQLKNDIVSRGYAITAGDVGHPYLTAALMTSGMSDILNIMTGITETPGYGYQVVNGATTLTEEWDGPMPGKPHGSQNHLMLGSIDEWFWCGLGGIESIRTGRSFDHLHIRPHIAEGTDYCSVWMEQPSGRLAVEWRRTDEGAEVKVTVPPNMTAVLCSEASDEERTVGSGVHVYSVRC